MMNRINDIQGLLRTVAASFLEPGDVVVDATAGRGRDTLFLAHAVGKTGQVFAFDIQPQALAETQHLLSEAGCAGQVKLILADHARMDDYIENKVKAIVFNLGYLPGSDHLTVTLPHSTRAAIQAGLKLLKPGGLMVLTLYRGHSGALEEALTVEEETSALSKKNFSVLKGCYINQEDTAPYWILVQKHRED